MKDSDKKDIENKDTVPEESGRKKRLRKGAAGAAAGIAMLSLLVGSVFSKPAEVMERANPDEGRPAVIVEIQATDDSEVTAEEEEADEKKRGLKDMICRFIQGLPTWAKITIIMPLWVIGYGLIALFTALFEPVSAPVLTIILKWPLVAGLLAGAFFLIKRAVAPDTPLKEIFSKRNIVLIVIAAAALGTGDYFAKMYFENYVFWRNLGCAAAGLLILGFWSLRAVHRKKQKSLPQGT